MIGDYYEPIACFFEYSNNPRAERLREAVRISFDPATHHLNRWAADSGWTCLEVRRVRGRSCIGYVTAWVNRVVAVNIDPRFIEALNVQLNSSWILSVRNLNLISMVGSCARCFLILFTNRDAAFQHQFRALKPVDGFVSLIFASTGADIAKISVARAIFRQRRKLYEVSGVDPYTDWVAINIQDYNFQPN